ncbi:hypothetical protein, partial [Streptomyces sp. GbtcB7]|uniref:hypothetical protein n=1 Tax=Streptomyces sp. GbtcB7 TaxID=2824752 RepID=UPI001C2F9D58
MESSRTVEVLDLSSAQLPVPADAVSFEGLSGTWRIAAENGTVVSPSSAARGQRFDVVARSPAPTIEQARAAPARGGPDGARGVPAETPDDIG